MGRKKKGSYRCRREQTEGITTSENDFFPTYHALTRYILNEIKFKKDDTFLEPCAGAGDITKVIREFYPESRIDEFDIKPRRDGIAWCDFVNEECRDHVIGFPENHRWNVCITNPPFKLFLDFFEACSIYVDNYIIFMAPLDYLHSVERWGKIYNKGLNNFYLDTCYVLVRRPLFDKKWRPDGLMPTGATSFAWFVFRKLKRKPITKIKWIHNNDEMGVPIEADQIMMQDMAYTHSQLEIEKQI